MLQATIPNDPDEVKDTVYRAGDVRERLIADQFSKCAYCESIVTKQFNDVDHYRPKKEYYWLGHQWENLLYACPLCNRTYKKHHFPLKDESKRHQVALETPLIINPTTEDPAQHIKYNRHIMVPRIVDGVIDEKGKATIDLFQLNNRKPLVSEREQLYETFEMVKRKKEIAKAYIKSSIHTNVLIARELLDLCNELQEKMKAPSTPYSGMLTNLE